MRRLLGSTALALIAAVGIAGAEPAGTGTSVLERVLSLASTTGLQPVTGVFANVAENLPMVVGGPSTIPVTLSTASPDTVIGYVFYDNGVSSSASVLTIADLGTTQTIPGYGSFTISNTGVVTAGTANITDVRTAGYGPVSSTSGAYALLTGQEAVYRDPGGHLYLLLPSVASGNPDLVAQFATVSVPPTILNRIDGSVSTTATGVDGVTAHVNGTVDAVINQVYLDLGNISVTVLGTVNTGTITLGASSSAQTAAAGAALAVDNATRQLGGAGGLSALALNVASNATGVVGTVSNSLSGVSGAIGSVSTTVLGAVNTGTITSGVNAVTDGVVAGIVGTPP